MEAVPGPPAGGDALVAPAASFAVPEAAPAGGDALVAPAAAFAARLLGAWELVSFVATLPDGSTRAPYGEGARGMLVYAQGPAEAGSARGAVSVHIARAPAERPAWATSDPAAGTPDERAAAAGSYRAYSGRFEVALRETGGGGGAGLGAVVAHAVELSLMPNRVGTTLERRATLARDARAGEERLVLEPLVPTPGAAGEALTWRRRAA